MELNEARASRLLSVAWYNFPSFFPSYFPSYFCSYHCSYHCPYHCSYHICPSCQDSNITEASAPSLRGIQLPHLLVSRLQQRPLRTAQPRQSAAFHLKCIAASVLFAPHFGKKVVRLVSRPMPETSTQATFPARLSSPAGLQGLGIQDGAGTSQSPSQSTCHRPTALRRHCEGSARALLPVRPPIGLGPAACEWSPLLACVVCGSRFHSPPSFVPCEETI